MGQAKVAITPQLNPSARLLSDLPSIKLETISLCYRNWQIGTKVIDGQLWLQWQHPHERSPRYGTLVLDNRLAEAIHHVQSLIDLTIKLEQEANSHSLNPQLSSPDTKGSARAESHSPNSAPLTSKDLKEDIGEFLMVHGRWG